MSDNSENKGKYRHPFKREHIPVDGFFISRRYLELRNDFDNVEVDENDIWICTFPKVGTTWTQEMVWMIINNLDFENGKKLLEERSPFIDFSTIYDDREWYNNHKDYNPMPFIHDSIAFYNASQKPRVVKTHLPYSFLPKQIRNHEKNPKLICVTRNSKDTCVSYYYHCKLLEGFVGTFEEFSEMFLAGKVNYGPFWKFILEYWNHRNDKNVLIIKYEDMKKDISQIIRQVLKFLNRTLTENQIEILKNHLSFESMRKNPAINKEGLEKLNKKMNDAGGKFMRAGKVGDYKNIMSEEMIRRFEEFDNKWLEGTDFKENQN